MMRDPELMQRADRAAIALEEAWERWRAMHGLGSEPLPPVSSYVGYSLEEPWGQPRVVFGLRADEAELLASLLDGHDCVGPIYAEVSTRPGWRRPVNGPTQLPRPYANPLTVPAQAPPSPLDQLGHGGATDDDPADDTDDMDAPDPVADGVDEIDSDPDAGAADEEQPRSAKARRPGPELEAESGRGGKAEAGGAAQSAPLAPLPELADLRRDDDEATPGDQARQGSSKRSTTRRNVPTQGPGYRGPRYQGSPPRYDTGAARAAAKVPDDNDEEADAEPAARRSPVTKLNRGTRRRPSGG
jgi:hypothetical protein